VFLTRERDLARPASRRWIGAILLLATLAVLGALAWWFLGSP
jgi:ferric-dicitrate binding protein FerR (iron transport regulator)